jgi:hypothetical protein
MGLGISFGFQPSGQRSIINVCEGIVSQQQCQATGQRLTSSAGGQDDGQDANGALITVGGLDDSNANPADPNATDQNCAIAAPRCDDELYSLLPFITAQDTAITVFSQNPTNDDNIFFAYFHLSGAAIVGQGIVLGPTDATNPVGTQHTVTAKVTDGTGQPVSGIVVSFEVLSGPNDGKTGTDTTDANGEATFTYTDDGGAGTDQIQASFLVSVEETKFSNIVTKTWGSEGNHAPTADSGPVTTAEDTPIVIRLVGNDEDNDPLTFSIVDQPQHGTLSAITPSTAKQTATAKKQKQKQAQIKIKGKPVPGAAPPPSKAALAAIVRATVANNVTYTPNPNYNGPDSFTFKVNDGTVDSAKATITINVTPVADPIEIQAIDFVRRPTGTSAGYTYASPGIAAVAKLLNPDGDSTAAFVILTIRALNLPKNCGSNVVKSDEIDLAPPTIRETVPVIDNPDSEDPADTQGEIKVLEIGPAAIAAAGNCAVTLQLTAFSMRIDELPSTTVTLDQAVCVDSDGGAAYSCGPVTTLAKKNSVSRAASAPAGAIKIAPPRFR